MDKEQQVNAIKYIVQASLRELELLEDKISELSRRKKYIRLNLSDMRDGRLDRIVERQRKDPDAEHRALFLFEQASAGIDDEQSPYHIPYVVMEVGKKDADKYEVTSAMCRHSTIGAYKVTDDKIIHFR